MKFSNMENMFPGLLNIFENSCNERILTKFAGGVKLKAKWKVNRETMMKITEGTSD